MPAMSRIADRGVRLSQFHTTALCSPTRAALLTGRNPTTVGMATIEEFTDGFPNCSGRIPNETALLSEVLAERGWNTYCVGKWHLTPLEESNLAASKRHWPLGRGFERFYGFLGGETDQWYPELVYDNHPVSPPGTPEQGYHLSKDLADKTIEFIRDAKVIAPDKPWFSYVCPGAGHAPHHVPTDWADRYRGRFDMGYERYREVVLENQQRMGLVPQHTELSPMNPYQDVTGPGGEPWPEQDTVRPWESLNDEEKRLFARMAEVFAGFLSYTDDQIGRVLDYLEESGQLDNTIIVVISDNGASGEGGPSGSVNEVKFFNGYIDTVEESLRYYDELGGPSTYGHYPIGWAMAFNTPYKLYKRYASHEGGVADPAIIAWPNGIAAHGEIRDVYANVCDVTPTVFDLLDICPPATVRGVAQKPLEGVSFAAALKDPEFPTGKHTQFYTMLGTRGIWHQGWFANTVHAASPAGWGHFDTDRWELYHIESDRSQCRDLADEHPERLEELKALWFSEAAKYNGLPLGDLNIFETLARSRPYLVGERQRFTYYPDTAEIGPGAGVELRGQSFSVLVEVTVDTPKPRVCSSSTAPGTAAMCSTSPAVHCTTSTTSWARTNRPWRRPTWWPPASTCSGCALSGPGPSRAATRRWARSRCMSTTSSWPPAPTSAPIPAPSGWPGAGSRWGATAAKPSRRPIPRRTRSPVASSPRPSSTSRARRMWTSNANSRRPSRRTDPRRPDNLIPWRSPN